MEWGDKDYRTRSVRKVLAPQFLVPNRKLANRLGAYFLLIFFLPTKISKPLTNDILPLGLLVHLMKLGRCVGMGRSWALGLGWVQSQCPTPVVAPVYLYIHNDNSIVDFDN